MHTFRVIVMYLIITTIAIVKGQNYRAGVVLHKTVIPIESTPDEELDMKVKKAITLMKSYAGKVDIFVLPEYALTNLRAEKTNKANLEAYSIKIGNVSSTVCTTDGPKNSLVKLACAAKNNYYILANFIEQEGNNYYLTDVAFDPNGVLCLKCRKQNLVNATNFQRAPDRNSCHFTATLRNQSVAFSVLYGTDLVYGIPEGIKADNIIVTSATKNSLPLNYSVSLSQGFAVSNGINLIVAENSDGNSYGGSGIFYANGSSVVAFNASNIPGATNNGGVLIREVPIKPPSTNIVNVESTMDGSTPLTNLLFFDLPSLNESNLEGSVCVDKRCCKYKAEVTGNSISPYKWVVMQNKTNLLDQEVSVFFCGIVVPSATFTPINFKNISISVDDKQPDVILALPITLNQNLIPTNFQFNKQARSVFLNKESTVVVFGILEILDPNVPNSGGSTGMIVIVVLLILVLVALLIAFLVWRKRQSKNRRNF